MGDGNMHCAAAMKSLDGMSTYAARHEHCACAMAMGYYSATGKTGVASDRVIPEDYESVSASGHQPCRHRARFRLRGATVTDLCQLVPLFEAYAAHDTTEIWNIHVSDRVVNASTRRTLQRAHGRM
jgi:hypothetical protein